MILYKIQNQSKTYSHSCVHLRTKSRLYHLIAGALNIWISTNQIICNYFTLQKNKLICNHHENWNDNLCCAVSSLSFTFDCVLNLNLLWLRSQAKDSLIVKYIEYDRLSSVLAMKTTIGVHFHQFDLTCLKDSVTRWIFWTFSMRVNNGFYIL